jgi:Tol biopolymer transport system component
VMSLDDAQTTLLSSTESIVSVSVAPTDNRIAVVEVTDGRFELRVHRVDSSGLSEPLLSRTGEVRGDARWSPDGTMLAVSTPTESGGAAMVVLDAATGAVMRSFDPTTYVVEPDFGCSAMEPVQLVPSDWSPDGSRIIGTASSFCVEVVFEDLVMFDLAAGSIVEVADVGISAERPSFSPDGTAVAFGSIDVGAAVVDLESGIVTGLGVGMWPSWNDVTGELAVVQLSDQGLGAIRVLVGPLDEDAMSESVPWTPEYSIEAPGAFARWLDAEHLLVISTEGAFVHTGPDERVEAIPGIGRDDLYDFELLHDL